MIIQWIALGLLLCFTAFSYVKHYTFKIRIISIVIFLIISLLFVLPIFHFSIFTLLGLFLLEKLWILLVLVLFIEVLINKDNRILRIIFGSMSIIIYFFLRTMI